jgi:hypothetical protein
MHHLDDQPVRWCPTQVPRGFTASFRRWNIVTIAILAFLVIGFLVASITPVGGSQDSAAKSPAQRVKAAEHRL